MKLNLSVENNVILFICVFFVSMYSWSATETLLKTSHSWEGSSFHYPARCDENEH